MLRKPATPDTSQFPEDRNDAPFSGLASPLKYFEIEILIENCIWRPRNSFENA